MHRPLLDLLKSHRHLLLAGALLGASAAACDPKQIGDETSGSLTCQDGEKKPAGDGCNTCTCEGGEWACTEIACDPDACVEGETKPAGDNCNTCTCYQGEWACTLLGCPSTEGVPASCGDGIVQAPEDCDDGNNVNSDGCSAECTDEGGETATEGTGSEPNETEGGTEGEPNETENGTLPDSGCGDGFVEGDEQCDDGNNADGDGCSSNCTIEGSGGPLWCPDSAPADPFTILEAAIVGDKLALEVQYGGGCQTHEFAYCWDGAFAESDPVQIWTKISHEDNDDPCDALPTEALEFDLTDLKKAWQQGYQQQSGEITVHLEGWPASLAYVF